MEIQNYRVVVCSQAHIYSLKMCSVSYVLTLKRVEHVTSHTGVVNVTS